MAPSTMASPMPRDPPVTKKTTSGLEPLEHADAVDPAEPEGVLHQIADLAIHGSLLTDVQIDLRIELVDVDRRMELRRVHLEDCRHGLDDRRGPARVAQHGLGRVDLELVTVLAENALD